MSWLRAIITAAIAVGLAFVALVIVPDLVLSQIVSSPHLDQIRQSPRFAAVMRRFKLDVARVTAPDGGRAR